MKTRILSRANLVDIAPMSEVVEAVEAAFVAHARGKTQMPPKVYLEFPEHEGDLRAMPSAMAGAAGVKWVNSHPHNPERHNLPSVMGVYILSDPATALPLAILDGTLLTALRTGAAAAVASRHLATNRIESMGFVGCGVQARYLLSAHRAVFGDGFECLCADLRAEAASTFAAEVGALGLRSRAASPEEAAGADIVNTATPGSAIAVQAEWVRPHAHVNAMGADAPGKQEIASDLLARAQIVIDERYQATHSGEINVALSEGRLADSDLAGTLGQVVLGEVTLDRDRLTVFDSTGLAVQDLAVAQLLWKRAQAANVGQVISLTE
ncbi:MAG: ornithine cyclodeaminase family protein [Myxococcota bacterium]